MSTDSTFTYTPCSGLFLQDAWVFLSVWISFPTKPAVLNTLDRPGTDAWVQPVGPNRLKNISVFLEGADIVKYESAQPEMTTRHEDLMERRCNIAATAHLWT